MSELSTSLNHGKVPVMDLKPIRVGLIGANASRGWSAATHLPALHALSDFELVAVCTTNQQSAEETAQRYGAKYALTDARALAALDDVDLVVVSIRAPYHAAHVQIALDANKHVLCEWPLGKNSAESKMLLNQARQKQVRHFVSLQGQAAAAIGYANSLISDGYLGTLLSATMTVTNTAWGAVMPPGADYLADAANGVTVVSILGGHALDMLSALVGEFAELFGVILNRREEATSATTGQMLVKTSPDQMLVAGILASGAPVGVHIQGGSLARDEFIIDLRGTEGALRLTSQAVPEIMPLTLLGVREPGGVLQHIEIPLEYCTSPAALGLGPAVNIAQLYRQIATDLQSGSRTAPDFASAVARHDCLDAIQLASDTGQRQRLKAAGNLHIRGAGL